MNLIEIFILLFSLSLIPSSFLPYKKSIKSKFWPAYSFTGHALITSSATIILSILGYDFIFLKIISGSLMFVSGYGLLIILSIYTLENRKFLFKLNEWIIIWIFHAIIALMGIWFLFNAIPQLFDLLISILFLILYATFMQNKIDVPWIVYSPSKIPKITRKVLIRCVMYLLYILLPILVVITKT